MRNPFPSSRSGHLIDSELVATLELWPIRELSLGTLAAAREQMGNAPKRIEAAGATDVLTREVLIPRRDNAPPMRALVHAQPGVSGSRPAYLHVHGGGFVMGRPEGNEDVDRDIASAHGCVVVSPAYQLAPEAPFPAAVEDLYSTLRWMVANAGELQIDAKRIVIGGESAGGGLAAALALLARDRGDASVSAQLLAYPMLDDRTGSTSEMHQYAGEFLWTAAMNRFAWQCLLGQAPGGADVSPHAAAARAAELAGLPPTYLYVGTLDLFFDEVLSYAKRLVAAGVATELHVYPGAYHAFDMAAEAALSARYRADRFSAFARCFARPE